MPMTSCLFWASLNAAMNVEQFVVQYTNVLSRSLGSASGFVVYIPFGCVSGVIRADINVSACFLVCQ